jgi:hypothetical protein
VTAKVATNTPARYASCIKVIDPPGTPWDDVHWLYLCHLLRHGDIFVGYFQSLFFGLEQLRLNDLCFTLLRLIGIRIIVRAQGGDVVHLTPFRPRFDWVARMQKDYPDWNLEVAATERRPIIRLFCKHAALVLPADSSLARFLPRNDLLYKYFPVDTDALCPGGDHTGNSVPVIAHAPTHRFVKGTDCLLSAVERLRALGVPCELLLIENKCREEAWRLYGSADIIADQFCIGAFGAFACEGLALGKPVLTYLDQEHLGNPVFNHPIVNTNPENLAAVLAVLLLVPRLRERLGQAGRRSVLEYQSIPALAEVWDRIYQHVWWGRPLRVDDTRHFSRERNARSYTEDPSRTDFWPVPMEDLLDDVLAALRRVGHGKPATHGGAPILASAFLR